MSASKNQAQPQSGKDAARATSSFWGCVLGFDKWGDYFNERGVVVPQGLVIRWGNDPPPNPAPYCTCSATSVTSAQSSSSAESFTSTSTTSSSSEYEESITISIGAPKERKLSSPRTSPSPSRQHPSRIEPEPESAPESERQSEDGESTKENENQDEPKGKKRPRKRAKAKRTKSTSKEDNLDRQKSKSGEEVKVQMVNRMTNQKFPREGLLSQRPNYETLESSSSYAHDDRRRRMSSWSPQTSNQTRNGGHDYTAVDGKRRLRYERDEKVPKERMRYAQMVGIQSSVLPVQGTIAEAKRKRHREHTDLRDTNSVEMVVLNLDGTDDATTQVFNCGSASGADSPSGCPNSGQRQVSYHQPPSTQSGRGCPNSGRNAADSRPSEQYTMMDPSTGNKYLLIKIASGTKKNPEDISVILNEPVGRDQRSQDEINERSEGSPAKKHKKHKKHREKTDDENESNDGGSRHDSVSSSSEDDVNRRKKERRKNSQSEQFTTSQGENSFPIVITKHKTKKRRSEHEKHRKRSRDSSDDGSEVGSDDENGRRNSKDEKKHKKESKKYKDNKHRKLKRDSSDDGSEVGSEDENGRRNSKDEKKHKKESKERKKESKNHKEKERRFSDDDSEMSRDERKRSRNKHKHKHDKGKTSSRSRSHSKNEKSKREKEGPCSRCGDSGDNSPPRVRHYDQHSTDHSSHRGGKGGSCQSGGSAGARGKQDASRGTRRCPASCNEELYPPAAGGSDRNRDKTSDSNLSADEEKDQNGKKNEDKEESLVKKEDKLTENNKKDKKNMKTAKNTKSSSESLSQKSFKEDNKKTNSEMKGNNSSSQSKGSSSNTSQLSLDSTPVSNKTDEPRADEPNKMEDDKAVEKKGKNKKGKVVIIAEKDTQKPSANNDEHQNKTDTERNGPESSPKNKKAPKEKKAKIMPSDTTTISSHVQMVETPGRKSGSTQTEYVESDDAMGENYQLSKEKGKGKTKDTTNGKLESQRLQANGSVDKVEKARGKKDKNKKAPKKKDSSSSIASLPGQENVTAHKTNSNTSVTASKDTESKGQSKATTDKLRSPSQSSESVLAGTGKKQQVPLSDADRMFIFEPTVKFENGKFVMKFSSCICGSDALALPSIALPTPQIENGVESSASPTKVNKKNARKSRAGSVDTLQEETKEKGDSSETISTLSENDSKSDSTKIKARDTEEGGLQPAADTSKKRKRPLKTQSMPPPKEKPSGEGDNEDREETCQLKLIVVCSKEDQETISSDNKRKNEGTEPASEGRRCNKKPQETTPSEPGIKARQNRDKKTNKPNDTKEENEEEKNKKEEPVKPVKKKIAEIKEKKEEKEKKKEEKKEKKKKQRTSPHAIEGSSVKLVTALNVQLDPNSSVKALYGTDSVSNASNNLNSSSRTSSPCSTISREKPPPPFTAGTPQPKYVTRPLKRKSFVSKHISPRSGKSVLNSGEVDLKDDPLARLETDRLQSTEGSSSSKRSSSKIQSNATSDISLSNTTTSLTRKPVPESNNNIQKRKRSGISIDIPVELPVSRTNKVDDKLESLLKAVSWGTKPPPVRTEKLQNASHSKSKEVRAIIESIDKERKTNVNSNGNNYTLMEEHNELNDMPSPIVNREKVIQEKSVNNEECLHPKIETSNINESGVLSMATNVDKIGNNNVASLKTTPQTVESENQRNNPKVYIVKDWANGFLTGPDHPNIMRVESASSLINAQIAGLQDSVMQQRVSANKYADSTADSICSNLSRGCYFSDSSSSLRSSFFADMTGSTVPHTDGLRRNLVEKKSDLHVRASEVEQTIWPATTTQRTIPTSNPCDTERTFTRQREKLRMASPNTQDDNVHGHLDQVSNGSIHSDGNHEESKDFIGQQSNSCDDLPGIFDTKKEIYPRKLGSNSLGHFPTGESNIKCHNHDYTSSATSSNEMTREPESSANKLAASKSQAPFSFSLYNNLENSSGFLAREKEMGSDRERMKSETQIDMQSGKKDPKWKLLSLFRKNRSYTLLTEPKN